MGVALQIVGAALAVVSAVVSCVGTNAQKKVHVREFRLKEHERQHYLSRPLWSFPRLLYVLLSRDSGGSVCWG